MTARSSAYCAQQLLDRIRTTVIANQATNLNRTRTLIATLKAGRRIDSRPDCTGPADKVIAMLEDLQRVNAAWLERWGG